MWRADAVLRRSVVVSVGLHLPSDSRLLAVALKLGLQVGYERGPRFPLGSQHTAKHPRSTIGRFSHDLVHPKQPWPELYP